ncbi:deoxyribodipyrimidine photo-lyase [Sulfuricurvum sp.]|uniref:cryptochrome/photolyase family protein n=1 Tax=Sulfuricurvum sp. TaxID=2025608 RepID=UPI002638D62C|nr:deoxyribodipyrimidine photo-lyase [Sulfuricurvum sp.]MDD4950434.1 deoxyribodipyrimidine photo-lyase [Sulfuricurvum sp.]
MKRILWFRRDLRVEDNPLLSHEGEVFPIFIFDTNILDKLKSNDRRVTFIFKTLLHLKQSLRLHGLDLAIFYGKPVDVFKWLLNNESYQEVSASGDYDEYALKRDRDISLMLPFNLHHDTYIFRPDEVLKQDGTPYLVFTPFYNRIKTHFSPEHIGELLRVKQTLIDFDYSLIHCIDGDKHTIDPITLETIGFIPQPLSKHQILLPEEKLALFEHKLENYSKNRDFMALDVTSSLGVDLRFGTISIRALLRWLVVQKQKGCDTEPFFRQLIFRDFYAMLLYHFPHLAWKNYRYPFKGIKNDQNYEAFCSGNTGVPIVDAGIQQLLESGKMHNRVRMICASFFTKNLLLPWQWGERFFAEHLIDYDAASNILSWQWSAGTGVDPQPYFRIFNPYTQTAKFDKEGIYIKQYLPIVQNVPSKFLANESYLRQYTISNYPKPIVDHKISAQRALEYFHLSF